MSGATTKGFFFKAVLVTESKLKPTCRMSFLEKTLKWLGPKGYRKSHILVSNSPGAPRVLTSDSSEAQ